MSYQQAKAKPTGLENRGGYGWREAATLCRFCKCDGGNALAFALAFTLPLLGCGHKNHAPAAAPPLPTVAVRTQTVESRSMPVVEEVVGTVRAKLRATLEAKASGRILEMPVILGQKVRAGELVARLDAPEVKARVELAEAGLQQAEREWKRVSTLYNQQAATRADSDAAESRHLAAKAALAEARAMLGYVEILAPFNGVVTRKWADVGDLAAPGKPLVDMEDPAKLQIEADVPEAIAPSIQQAANLRILLSDGTNGLTGTVAEIAPIVDPASRTFRVKLDLPSGPSLMSGQFARLAVPVGEAASLRVPSSAVVQRGQMEIVFAVENQRAQLHLVKTGRRSDGQIEILSGLDPGKVVVVDNPSQLADGQPVETK